jgi:hypothetical protein
MKESFDGNIVKYKEKNERELSSSYIDFNGKLGEEISQEMYDTCCERLEKEINFFKYIIEDPRHPENAEEITQIKFEEFKKTTEAFKKIFQNLQIKAEETCLISEKQPTKEISEKARILYGKLSNLRIKANELNYFVKELNNFELSDFKVHEIKIPETDEFVEIKDAFNVERIRDIVESINYDRHKEIQAKLLKVSNEFPEEPKKKELK